ncbi:MAG TPA: tetraacyldisaccharide 4'-kinase [Terracidiphilus sp.]|nr:tetraacyldisaccharide 4'-kinase [Terracidiphilus sp.]
MRRPWLAPLVPLYAAGAALRGWRRGPAQRLRWPVISIGNLSVGGSGKTPLTIALARLLSVRGFHVDVLSRGYGRRSSVPLRVDPGGSAENFGDEPLLIAKSAGVPVYVAAERFLAGRLAESDRPDIAERAVHILDDGYQHRQLHRDVDILVLDREDLRDSLLPAGNLREGLRAALRADVMVIRSDEPNLEADLRARGLQCPIWRLHRRMDVPPVSGPVMAFCGIARPAQFFAGLDGAGVQIAVRKSFPDHYDYTEHVIEWLVEKARSSKAAAFLTTEKDLARFGDLVRSFPADLPLLTAGLTVQIDHESMAIEWLLARLESSGSQRPV